MIVLVADSGRLRKSTAIRLNQEYVKEANIRVIKGKSSPEAFLMQLDPHSNSMNDSVAFLVISELSVFLSKQTYAEPLIDLLTDLADADDVFEYTTKKDGKVKLLRPCITMLAATTPVGLGENIPAKAHSTGFMSRVLYVYARETDRCDALTDVEDKHVDFTEVKRMEEIHKHLLSSIQSISQLAGPFTYTKDGRDWYEAAYKDWVNSSQGKGEGYPSRRMEHLLRIAMVLVVTNSQNLILDERSLKAADMALQKIEAEFPSAFAYIGNSAARDRDVILNTLRQNGGKLPLSALYGKICNHFNYVDDVAKTLNMMTAAGLITFSRMPNSNDGVYSLTASSLIGR